VNDLRRFVGDEEVNVIGGGATETANGKQLSGELVAVNKSLEPNIHYVTVVTGSRSGLRFNAYSDELSDTTDGEN